LVPYGPVGPPAPVNSGYKDSPICQAMGFHGLTAQLQAILN
jgi:hypothetical protein